MKTNELDILKSTLGEFFRDMHYKEAIKKLRKSIKERDYYKKNWQDVVLLIVNKKLNKGEPLELIHNNANLPLDENTDEEAYKWLTLMLVNSAGSVDDFIIEY